ncbi:MAG TPA: PDZ domain-containing protein [Pyrinomonadaceae bacterium]|nr:PDZ domain-containing protein [Pyrinomonadaceae bacterium]
MAIRGNTKVRTFVFMIALVLGWQITSVAQVATPSVPAAPAPKREQERTGSRRRPVTEENRAIAPQVVTILHRLNGMKMFRLLVRSNDELRAITKVDDAFKFTDEVHTNVIAGLALEDGKTIVARLPDAQAELGPPPGPFAPLAPAAPPPPGVDQKPRAMLPSSAPMLSGSPSYYEQPDLTVIARDGKRVNARYIGLDGVTGLSVLKLSDNGLWRSLDANENGVSVGQHLRLFGPEPVRKGEVSNEGLIYARMGETDGMVVELTRSPSGVLARVRIKSTKLSAANIGGIAVNDAGETIGIVDAVEDSEASVLPSTMVRTAAKRVLDRQASVPRPWLGVRGDPVGALQIEQLLTKGWEREGAMSLAEARRGIMLTSVAPGSPAAEAALRPGDVILQVNKEEVRSADDFSWLLEEAGPGGSVYFTVARPGKIDPEKIEITLSESPDSPFEWRFPDYPGTKFLPNNSPEAFQPGFFKSVSHSLIAQGIETIALMPQVALRFGGTQGLLVIYVQPTTTAFKAGLRSGDLIEAIDGKRISAQSQPGSLFTNPVKSHLFSIVRNKGKMVVSIASNAKQ